LHQENKEKARAMESMKELEELDLDEQRRVNGRGPTGPERNDESTEIQR
jgi:hypothetical protein